jgi:hypothetical protein
LPAVAYWFAWLSMPCTILPIGCALDGEDRFITASGDNHPKGVPMKTIAVQSLAALFGLVIALLLQISPALAGAPDVGSAMTQGSLFPGLPVPGTETNRHGHQRPVEITYTKWAHKNDDGTFGPLLEGFTGGDVSGTFVGEALLRQVSRDLRVIRLEAAYEVQAGNHSFAALIRGGTGETTPGEPASVSGAALLDGVILAGWRTGARVHVAFQTYAPPPSGPGCPDRRAPTDRPCFQGTISISRHSDD